ncbi:MAG: Eco57I restriction-modification methylase domain-containing protein [Flavobacterium sp.]|nr:Eco57I restriction-modification methylase domain-containing protein [Flavobacterium sp.]
MKLAPKTPQQFLKPFLKQKPVRSEIDNFKLNLITLLDKISIIEQRPKDESEEHLKNDLRDFMRDTYYRDTNAINTKDKKDLVIHLGKSTSSEVGVIVEAKRPTNISEMVSVENPNKKALHELILYYLDERITIGNNQLKQLVITNINEWYIIDANYFDKYIYRNSQIKKLYETKKTDKKDNPFFYEELAKIISKIEIEIPCVYFNISDYSKVLRNNNKNDDKQLIALFKILSPQHLLKIVSPGDSNSLNEKFYKELLHIIGLEEAKENGKNIIRRKKEGRNAGSFLELTIDALQTEDVLHRLPDQLMYGADKEERLYNVALELCITWINRILFLKLLEGQLVTYHQGDLDYRFLNSGMINDFDELFKLFHKVLAINANERTDAIKSKYARVPYLNSSLFEISDLENYAIKINSLDNGGQLEFIANTVLKELSKNVRSIPVLEYLFNFLSAYDFASEGTQEIQEDNKVLINASVLGKVFEKINGYKDGSIFTPAFITMYMCKQSIRQTVVDKFNEELSGDEKKSFDTFADLRNYTSRLFKTQEVLKANEVINSLRICDPAVGSGHFLVSSLNEIITIKAELGILADQEGNSISGYEIEVINDELIITDPKGNILEYLLHDGKPLTKEIQRLQKALFHEKQNIIENCLFGVDINPNSVKICRLRLWIELLKNAYYKEEAGYTELETLPNIDINIKCGNSLINRFSLDADLTKALKNIKHNIKAYRDFVQDYKNEKNRDAKRELQTILDGIKNNFRTNIDDPFKSKISKARGDVTNISSEVNRRKLWGEKIPKELKVKLDKAEIRFAKLEKEKNDILNNVIYKNAFEWRFEFPEVLDNSGNFEGFDIIIGNPPYIQLQKLEKEASLALEQQGFQTYTKSGDIYQLFYEHGLSLLKPKGQLAFITSNKWMRTDYGTGTRKFLATKCKTKLVVDFGMLQIFDNATTYTNILFLSKDKPKETMKMCRVKDKFDMTLILEDYIDYSSVEIENPHEKSWIAYEKKEYELIKKIIQKGKPLKDWDIHINRGVLTGFNEAFVITTEKKNQLIAEDPKSAEILKPLLRGEDIKAYVPQWDGWWLIATFPSLKFNISDYPAVENYLLPLKERLAPKPKDYDDKKGKWKGRKNGSYRWFETQDSIAYHKDFLKDKIIYPNMTKYMPFVYDKHQFFTNQKCFIITGNLLSYLTCFLNSKIFRFAFKEYFPELLGDTRELSKIFFELVSVESVDESTNIIFEALLEKLVELKEQGKSIEEIENEIEQKLAKIYSLSEEEVKLIESSEGADKLVSPAISERSAVVSS